MRLRNGGAAALAAVAAGALVMSQPSARAGVASTPEPCAAGARTLSHLGDHVYPETGNGGYVSVHTDIHMVYDATTNRLLPGNHVVLTDRAAQCLTDLSLDFERTSTNTTAGPDMRVEKVLVNGAPARFRFVQPTYPGDPNGQDDRNPQAHEAGQNAVAGGPQHNPLPPACTPELPDTSAPADALDGTPCPANKMVVVPAQRLRRGETFTVTVYYTGRPGVHNDGDGTTEGWFRSDVPPGDGGFVTTEPVGSEDWMPLNDHPSAKPTYDFYDTINAGKAAIANGELVSVRNDPSDPRLPGGATTWHWHSPEPVASYLVENSVGAYDLSRRLASDGIEYYEAQASAISADQKAANRVIMDQQQDITDFQSQFNGPYPFTTAGVVIGLPSASFEEEMQTKITFNGGRISLGTFVHENMHQWWGDNVTESNYDMTFFKEGFATLGQYLFTAYQAEQAAGGPGTAAGRAAFGKSLIDRFDTNYASDGDFWMLAPSDPTPYTLFNRAPTYVRPGTAYIALRQILGHNNFLTALRQIQRHDGGGHITEPQLEAAFQHWLPNHTPACHARLAEFFTEWFDTAYPPGGGANRPQLTGPGLAGPGFYDSSGGCTER